MSRPATWASELDELERRVAALERTLAGDGTEPDTGPWEPPAPLGAPTPPERARFEQLMKRLAACRAGVEEARRELAARLAEDQQRRLAVRRYRRA